MTESAASMQLEAIIRELQSRIGSIVSEYELTIASLKAEANMVISDKDRRIAELQDSASGGNDA